MTDDAPGDVPPLDPAFGQTTWIMGTIHAALVQNLGIEVVGRKGMRLLDLLDRIRIEHSDSQDGEVARLARHADVVALLLRGFPSIPDPQRRDAVVRLKAIAKGSPFDAHPATRDIARHLLATAGPIPVSAPGFVQVLRAPVEGREWARYNNLHDPLPLPAMPDLHLLGATLEREFPWLQKITETIIRELSLSRRLGRDAVRLHPLMLAGPPGTGKSRYSRRLSELLGLPSLTISCAGSSDSMTVRGTSRGWSSARPGILLEVLQRHNSPAALIVWDELDKASPSTLNGRIWDACLQLLERETASRYFDEALEVACDLSWASHVATVNTLQPIPRPLLERFHIELAPAPRPEHFESILQGVMNEVAREYDLADPRLLPSLAADDRRHLHDSCGLNPRRLAHAARILLAEKLQHERRLPH